MAHNEIVEGELEDEGREVTTGALVAISSAEINQQIMTAKAYPRDVTTFRKKVLTAATIDEQVAKSCMYALKRRGADGDKVIEGPSARFAEIVAQTWGNCRAGARVVEVGETHITAQGFFYDLENNVAVSFEVMRPIVGKKTPQDPNGKRFTNDMIGVTGNAACSIALRNAVFKGVPKAYWNHGYLAARATVAGDMATIGERRTKLLKAFETDFGVKPEQVYALIGVKGAPDISLDHMVFLGGLHNTIQEGETTAERAFHPDNFAKDGTMTPVAPQRSAFQREDAKPNANTEGAKVGDPVDVTEKAEANAPEQKTPAEPEPSAAERAAVAVEDDGRAARLRQENEDWFADIMAEADVVAKTGIKKLSDWRNLILPNLSSEQEVNFVAKVDRLTREIMESTTPGAGRKSSK